MDGVKKKKIITITIFALTVVLGVTALIITWRLQQKEPVAEPEAEAASEEVTDADTLKSETQRQIFASLWEEFVADESHTWEDYVSYAMGDGARYDCNAEIMTVGEETLYGCDLNAIFVLSEFPTYSSSDEITPQNSILNSVLDELITNSGLLQKGEELGLITLTSEIFNSPTKDMFARFEAISSVREEIGDSFVKKIDFEGIVVYFYNQEEPEVGETLAREAAKNKIDFLYEGLQSGEITSMEKAGDLLINEPQSGTNAGSLCYTSTSGEIKCATNTTPLSKLDRLYKENAYFKVEDSVFGEGHFTDPVYDDELRSLGEGQMSTVRTCSDYRFTNEELSGSNWSDLNLPFEESCFIIFKVNKIYFGTENTELNGDTLEEVIENAKEAYL